MHCDTVRERRGLHWRQRRPRRALERSSLLKQRRRLEPAAWQAAGADLPEVRAPAHVRRREGAELEPALATRREETAPPVVPSLRGESAEAAPALGSLLEEAEAVPGRVRPREVPDSAWARRHEAASEDPCERSPWFPSTAAAPRVQSCAAGLNRAVD